MVQRPNRRSLLGEPALAGGGTKLSIGADVDANPIKPNSRPVIINATDAQRAEILVRYRLYSSQPDEMITFRALSTIPKTHGDPRLYQYGGLWIYPVGALLKMASLVGLIDVRSDLAFYLDHPEAFARFYIVARLYVVAFAMVGVFAVFWLAKKMTGDAVAGMFAGCAFALMPVVINMAHEAKPHLPGAVLTLLAIIASVKYIETASRRWALCAGALCGCAFGMVLTGVASFILLPVMSYIRWRARPPLAPSRLRDAFLDLILASITGLLVYSVTNPFVIAHLLGDRTILQSNLANSQAMYRAALNPGTLMNAANLIADGATPVFAIAGALAILLIARRDDFVRKILLVVCLPILVQFVALASEKPGEYARFGLFLDVSLMLFAICGASAILKNIRKRMILMAALCAGCCVWSIGYVWHFGRDSIGARRD